MKKIKLNLNEKKLKLHKEKIASLTEEQQKRIEGGRPPSDPCATTILEFTEGNCDIPTIGHDDGPNCVSATDWGWCWCNGI